MNRRFILQLSALLAAMLLAVSSPADEISDAVKNANVLLRRGKAKEARALLEPLAAKHPRSAPLQYTLAHAAVLMRDMPRARRHLDRTIRIDPEHIDARLLLATIYRTEKKASKARKLLQEILKRDPRNAGAMRGMGDLDLDARRYEKAVDWYRKALEADPKDSRAMLSIPTAWSKAAVAMRSGPKSKRDAYGEKAIEAYRRLLKARPEFTQLHYNLGTIALLCEKFDLAVDSLDKFLEKRPGDGRGLFNLAQALEKQGNSARALETWQRFLQVASADKKKSFKKDIPRARRRIQELERELNKKK